MEYGAYIQCLSRLAPCLNYTLALAGWGECQDVTWGLISEVFLICQLTAVIVPISTSTRVKNLVATAYLHIYILYFILVLHIDEDT